MEIGKPGATPRQRVQVGRVDFAAKGAQVGKAPVVGHQHHQVRARRGRQDTTGARQQKRK